MSRQRRTVAIAASLFLLVALAVKQPSADIRILTHVAGDTAPSQVQAAVDLGLFAISVLITWTGRQLR